MVESLFQDAVVTLGGRTGPEAQGAYAAIDAAYRQGDRAYHNLRHVENVLETYLAIAEDLAPEDGARVTLALIYHDAVYDPRSQDNEARSAALARRELARLGIEEDDLREIERLILVTQGHAASEPLGRLVVDADLAVLQSPPEAYDRYAAAIRREYAFVPEGEYRAGRRRVLEELLGRTLFASPLLDEDAARENLRREMARLAD